MSVIKFMELVCLGWTMQISRDGCVVLSMELCFCLVRNRILRGVYVIILFEILFWMRIEILSGMFTLLLMVLVCLG